MVFFFVVVICVVCCFRFFGDLVIIDSVLLCCMVDRFDLYLFREWVVNSYLLDRFVVVVLIMLSWEIVVVLIRIISVSSIRKFSFRCWLILRLLKNFIVVVFVFFVLF